MVYANHSVATCHTNVALVQLEDENTDMTRFANEKEISSPKQNYWHLCKHNEVSIFYLVTVVVCLYRIISKHCSLCFTISYGAVNISAKVRNNL